MKLEISKIFYKEYIDKKLKEGGRLIKKKIKWIILIVIIAALIFVDYNNYFGLFSSFSKSHDGIEIVDKKIDDESLLKNIEKNYSITNNKGDIYEALGGVESNEKKYYIRINFRRKNEIPVDKNALLIKETDMYGTKIKYYLNESGNKDFDENFPVQAPEIIINFEKNGYFYNVMILNDDFIASKKQGEATLKDYKNDKELINVINNILNSKIKDLK